MRLLGDLALQTYWLAMQAARPFLPMFIARRERAGKEDGLRHQERLGLTGAVRPEGPLAWVHAASVGETNAVLPLCVALTERGFTVLITTVTTTAAQTVSDRTTERPGIVHQYAPLDVPSIVQKFLDHWQPSLAIFAESEIWPMTIKALSDRSIPSAIVNGRMSDRSFRRWRKFKSATPSLFGRIDQVLVRGEEDLLRFQELGAGKVAITGNLKYDSPAPKIDPEQLSRLRREIGQRPVFLATSTHRGEDEIVLQAHSILQQSLPNLLTCIVPRHPRRGESVAQLASQEGRKTELRTVSGNPSPSCEIYVADTLGELGLFYSIAPVALIGGSLLPVGGHNPIEAAQQGCAVLSGPHIFNFREVFGVLEGAAGCLIVTDAAQIAAAVTRCLADPLYAKSMAANATKSLDNVGGAVARSLAALEPTLARAISQGANLVDHPRNTAA
uniref:3-deoxy-D-manno-octulosonic acid transferase n=1 Tax=Pararhizobium sp. IMCC3301 TaxID=3067904 RepID=UPI0027408D23|nr:3-deoxy-D-manno-octulosonic acid transferase [Pararhizobium sp. IMCC3301]